MITHFAITIAIAGLLIRAEESNPYSGLRYTPFPPEKDDFPPPYTPKPDKNLEYVPARSDNGYQAPKVFIVAPQNEQNEPSRRFSKQETLYSSEPLRISASPSGKDYQNYNVEALYSNFETPKNQELPNKNTQTEIKPYLSDAHNIPDFADMTRPDSERRCNEEARRTARLEPQQREPFRSEFSPRPEQKRINTELGKTQETFENHPGHQTVSKSISPEGQSSEPGYRESSRPQEQSSDTWSVPDSPRTRTLPLYRGNEQSSGKWSILEPPRTQTLPLYKGNIQIDHHHEKEQGVSTYEDRRQDQTRDHHHQPPRGEEPSQGGESYPDHQTPEFKYPHSKFESKSTIEELPPQWLPPIQVKYPLGPGEDTKTIAEDSPRQEEYRTSADGPRQSIIKQPSFSPDLFPPSNTNGDQEGKTDKKNSPQTISTSALSKLQEYYPGFKFPELFYPRRTGVRFVPHEKVKIQQASSEIDFPKPIIPDEFAKYHIEGSNTSGRSSQKKEVEYPDQPISKPVKQPISMPENQPEPHYEETVLPEEQELPRRIMIGKKQQAYRDEVPEEIQAFTKPARGNPEEFLPEEYKPNKEEPTYEDVIQETLKQAKNEESPHDQFEADTIKTRRPTRPSKAQRTEFEETDFPEPFIPKMIQSQNRASGKESNAAKGHVNYVPYAMRKQRFQKYFPQPKFQNNLRKSHSISGTKYEPEVEEEPVSYFPRSRKGNLRVQTGKSDIEYPEKNGQQAAQEDFQTDQTTGERVTYERLPSRKGTRRSQAVYDELQKVSEANYSKQDEPKEKVTYSTLPEEHKPETEQTCDCQTGECEECADGSCCCCEGGCCCDGEPMEEEEDPGKGLQQSEPEDQQPEEMPRQYERESLRRGENEQFPGEDEDIQKPSTGRRPASNSEYYTITSSEGTELPIKRSR